MCEEEYGDRFVQMASNTERYGVLEKPDGYAKKTGDCGDSIELYLSVRGGRIRMVTFQIQGCLNTFACANTLSHLVEGRTVSDSWQVTPENLIDYLQTLPTDHHHCAELVVGTFYTALNDCNKKQREPWRKDYHKI